MKCFGKDAFSWLQWQLSWFGHAELYLSSLLLQGFPDMRPPQHVVDALCRAANSDNVFMHQYTRSYVSFGQIPWGWHHSEDLYVFLFMDTLEMWIWLCDCNWKEFKPDWYSGWNCRCEATNWLKLIMNCCGPVKLFWILLIKECLNMQFLPHSL